MEHKTQSSTSVVVPIELGSFILWTESFTRVQFNAVEPLHISSGFWYVCTALDRRTRWPDAVPLSEITAEAFAKTFVIVEVARFGCPKQITQNMEGNLRLVYPR